MPRRLSGGRTSTHPWSIATWHTPYHDWDSKVSPELKAKVDELKKQIVNGTLNVSTAYDPAA